VPRIRTIKPEFWADEKLAPLDPTTRLTFLGLISMADDTGRLVDNVKQIDAFLYPETDDTARQALETLAQLGRIRRGVTDSGQRVIQLVNWKHQKIDKPNYASCLPPIAGDPEDRYPASRAAEEPPPRPSRKVSPKRSPTRRGRVAETSPNDRRGIGETIRGGVVDASAPHINDLRSTINDRRSEEPRDGGTTGGEPEVDELGHRPALRLAVPPPGERRKPPVHEPSASERALLERCGTPGVREQVRRYLDRVEGLRGESGRDGAIANLTLWLDGEGLPPRSPPVTPDVLAIALSELDDGAVARGIAVQGFVLSKARQFAKAETSGPMAKGDYL
jgi:hypothetical protein